MRAENAMALSARSAARADGPLRENARSGFAFRYSRTRMRTSASTNMARSWKTRASIRLVRGEGPLAAIANIAGYVPQRWVASYDISLYIRVR
jgi:hypothetical protein